MSDEVRRVRVRDGRSEEARSPGYVSLGEISLCHGPRARSQCSRRRGKEKIKARRRTYSGSRQRRALDACCFPQGSEDGRLPGGHTRHDHESLNWHVQLSHPGWHLQHSRKTTLSPFQHVQRRTNALDATSDALGNRLARRCRSWLPGLPWLYSAALFICP